jgi:hypothetical protein
MANFSLTSDEVSFLKTLDSPRKIQDYLDSLPFNHEEDGETCMSPRRTLREKKAHCLEGAMLACVALMLNGEKPLILNLKVREDDYDHVVALYERNGYWGAISKTNHSVLRFRDPVYMSIRELAMTYFHEYFLVSNGEKTMRGYSLPINLRRFGTKWITKEDELWDIGTFIFKAPHNKVIPRENARLTRRATKLERHAAGIPQTTAQG